MWFRVFAKFDLEPPLGAMEELLTSSGYPVELHFRGDDLGWTSGEILAPPDTQIMVERFLTKEDSLRDDLNSWAAWLETMTFQKNAVSLMEQVIQSQQLITIRKPIMGANESQIEAICTLLCQFFTTGLEGIYQVDGKGFFGSDGECLLVEY